MNDPIEGIQQIAPSPRGGLRHEIVRRLLAAIFSGSLPPDTRLHVMKLADRFGTSSTPCREALVELAGIGVVEFIHNRGAVVAPFGPEQLGEIYQVRGILEAEAARCACGRVGSAELKELRDRISQLLVSEVDARWSDQAVETDQRFHALITSYCGSRRLAQEIGRYELLAQAGREIMANHPDAQKRAMEQHLAILDALLDNRSDKAAAAMAAHVASAAEVAAAAMFP